MWKYVSEAELYHHGVKGQRWGFRRYQYKDGALTPAGKRRADKLRDQYTQLTGKKLIRKPASKTSQVEDKTKKKSFREMSDTELKDRITRLQMEKQAIGLQNDLAGKGQKFVSTVGKQVVAPALIDSGKRLMTDWLMKYGKQKLGLETEAAKDTYAELRKEVDGLNLEKKKLAYEREIEALKKKKKEEK